MKQDYVVDQNYLAENFRLDLSDYIIDSASIPLFIRIGLEKAITRILFLNDNFKYESDIEQALDNNSNLVKPFKKLQFQILYNLTFLGDSNPINYEVDSIICCDLRWGAINTFQKQIWRK